MIVETVSSYSVQHGRDHLLLCFMYYICTGNTPVASSARPVGGTVSGNGRDDDRLTPLEKALAALHSLEPLCTDSMAQLASTVASLIKQQVLFY